MVEFEGGNPEKPVVIGAMFHGQGKSGHGGAGNFMKGFQTPSGNRLQLNDQDGSVLLTDQGTCDWKMDGSGNMSASANASIALTVGGSKESPDGNSKLGMVGNIVDLTSKNEINLTADTKITLTVGDSTIVMTTDTITIQSETVKVIGTSLTELGKDGADAGVKIDSNVTIKGSQVDIN
ncbi:hypothetical protein [Moheibacter stercoris]|uniref:Uncharacterized protein involved in type VI secretion and phage assembly n=1 Tax=Moheibacter stercoris TaxID=1628251 RepID=A0ABV2LUG5_9FLAO